MNNTIHITVYLHPLLYHNSEVFGGYAFDEKKLKCDPNSISTFKGFVNAPLDCEGEQLGNPVADEWEHYIKDLTWYIKFFGFRISTCERKDDPEKSECMIVFGSKDDDYSETIVCDLKMSENPFDEDFPEIFKDKVLEYLTIDKVLDGTAKEAGIDFQIERTTVQFESWHDAIGSVIIKLKDLSENWINWKPIDPEEQTMEENNINSDFRTITGISDDKLMKVAKEIMDKYDEAFKELAK